MYGGWLANGIAVATTLAVVVACVLVHYEGLLITQKQVSRPHRHARARVLHAILLLILVHVIEIWIFGLVYWALLLWPGAGAIAGPPALHLFDYIYFSATCFTTVGFGDLAPVGPIRFMAGTEALVGLVLITWSASFTFLEMERYWRSDRADGGHNQR